MSKNYFKYELQRGGGSLFTPRDLTWFERLAYRLKGYKVIEMDTKYWKAWRDRLGDDIDKKKTTVDIKIKLL